MSELFGSATEHPLNECSDTEERPIEIGDLGYVVPGWAAAYGGADRSRSQAMKCVNDHAHIPGIGRAPLGPMASWRRRPGGRGRTKGASYLVNQPIAR
jgi:hypothetical protein